MTIFDGAPAARRRTDGVYDAPPDQRFALVAPGGTTPPAVNGGVLIATVLRAVLDCSPLPHPVATSAHFLRIARLAPAEIHVTWLKTGRTAATARATLIQDGEPVLETTVTTGMVPLAASGNGRAAGERYGSGPAGGSFDDSADGGAAGGGGGGDGLTRTDAPPALPPIEQGGELGPWRGTGGPGGTAGHAPPIRKPVDPRGV